MIIKPAAVPGSAAIGMTSGIRNAKTYYATKGGAPRGPIKRHMAWFKQKQGMKIIYVANGTIVEQPEEINL